MLSLDVNELSSAPVSHGLHGIGALHNSSLPGICTYLSFWINMQNPMTLLVSWFTTDGGE